MVEKTIRFTDATGQGNGVVILRRSADSVGICVSMESNGDVEAFLSTNQAVEVAQAILEFARAAAES